MASKPVRNPTAERFRQIWPQVTADSNLTLHGFRRFKTTHLANLRFLEEEIAQLDHVIYQAGLSLGSPLSCNDRLGLGHSKRDANVPPINDTITEDMVCKLRGLLKDYDEALVAFNAIMNMETMSLLDDEQQSSMRTDLTLREKYETRLVRADLGTRTRTDPYQRWVHKQLRKFRYWRMSRSNISPEAGTRSAGRQDWSYQNTLLIATVVGRVIAAVMPGYS